MYAKIFEQIYDGTLCSKGPWQALVTFQQLLILADSDGCVDMTPTAISRRTTIPIEIIEQGIAALVLPDNESRTPDEEGKRIIPLSDNRSWGWRIVNYVHYRNLRDEESRRAYHRNYWHKRKEKLKTTQQDSTELNNSTQTQPRQMQNASAKADSKTLEGSLVLQPALKTERVLAPERERGRANARRASRLPDDASLTTEWIIEAQRLRPDLKTQQIEEIFSTFFDYWRAKSGKDATKTDWLATWRNWCRREKAFAKDQAAYMTPGQRKAAVTKKSVDEWLAENEESNTLNGDFKRE